MTVIQEESCYGAITGWFRVRTKPGLTGQYGECIGFLSLSRSVALTPRAQCLVNRRDDCRLGVDSRGVEQGDVHMVLLNQHRNFRTTRDDALGSLRPQVVNNS